jgi:hypothetical protein
MWALRDIGRILRPSGTHGHAGQVMMSRFLAAGLAFPSVDIAAARLNHIWARTRSWATPSVSS